MNTCRHLFFPLILLCICFSVTAKTIRVVVLGSSTAAGVGPTNIKNSWVNQLTVFLQSLDENNSVINLAVGGFTTYHVLPTNKIPPENRPQPDPQRNITAAIRYEPTLIIVNLPTNDVAYNYSLPEIAKNFRIITNEAKKLDIPIWITTTQPRNLDDALRKRLVSLNDTLYDNYPKKIIDFWSVLANNDGSINPFFGCGDGIHLNDLAHTLLKTRVTNTVDFATVSDSTPANIRKNRVLIVSNSGANNCSFEFYSDNVSEISISIYNGNGIVVKHEILANNYNNHNTFNWNLRSNSGTGVLNGIFIAKIVYYGPNGFQTFEKKFSLK